VAPRITLTGRRRRTRTEHAAHNDAPGQLSRPNGASARLGPDLVSADRWGRFAGAVSMLRGGQPAGSALSR